MEITWYGQTCFCLAKRGVATVVTGPCSPDTGLLHLHAVRLDANKRSG